MPDLDPAAPAATTPFAVHSGVQITAAKDAVVGHLDWAEERRTIGGLMHGGALMTLADSLGAVAAFNAGKRFITVPSDVVDDDERLLITTTQVQAVLACG